MAINANLAEFLEAVDEPPKPQAFVSRAVEVLKANDILCPADMKGLKTVQVIHQTVALSGGMYAFLERALAKLQPPAEQPPQVALPNQSRAEDLKEALMLFEKSRKPEEPTKLHVDLGVTIPKVTAEELPQCCWPISDAVDHIVTEVDKLKKKKGITDAYIYVDLKMFLPNWGKQKRAGHVQVEEESVKTKAVTAFAEALDFSAPPKQNQRLDILRSQFT